MSDQLRPATLADAVFVADVLSAGRPDDPVDPEMYRHEWENHPAAWTSERFIITRDGRDVGYGGVGHPLWRSGEQRFAFIDAELLPHVRTADALASALAPMEERARDDGATLAALTARDNDPVRIDAITGRGYREDRRGKRWELDLIARREALLAMAEESRARMRREGVRLLTLSADDDPERYRKLWRLSEEAAVDVPTTLPHVEETLDDFMAWLRQPGIYEDRVWIARQDSELLGLSVLEYPPVRGVVNTAWTATARSARGRGVARALKCETVAQAIGLGVDRVRTGNDAKNDPILHINQTMGYRVVVERITFHKPL